MNKDQVNGAAKDLAGKAQEGIGKALGGTEHQVKGLAKQVEGKIQKGYGEVKETVSDAAHHANSSAQKQR